MDGENDGYIYEIGVGIRKPLSNENAFENIINYNFCQILNRSYFASSTESFSLYILISEFCVIAEE